MWTRKKEHDRAIGRKEARASLWGEEAFQEEFPVVLMVLLSRLDLYCSCLGISQGLPDPAQGCCNSLWRREIKSKDKSNGKFPS